MSGNVRAYIVVITIGICVMLVLERFTQMPISRKEYRNWILYWLLVTTVAFLAHNYWLYLTIFIFLCLFVFPRAAKNPIPLYFLILAALPFISNYFRAFGLVNQLFQLTHPRILVLFLLLPTIFSQRSGALYKGSLVRNPVDFFVLGYCVLVAVLEYRQATLTQALRGNFLVMVDVYLPYYIVSRCVRTVDDFRRVFFAILASAVIMGAIGVFESMKGWYLYKSLNDALGAYGEGDYGSYRLLRAGRIRVEAIFVGPIIFGYFLVISLAMLTYLRKGFRSKLYLYIVGGGLVTCLFLTFSRGPWLGAIIFGLIYAMLGGSKVKSISRLVLIGSCIVPVMILMVGADAFVNLVPWSGGGPGETISYRQRLIEQGIQVVKQDPWFGSTDFLTKLESMRQGQGIIDIVNAYLQIALATGIVGLGLFVSVILGLLYYIHKTLKPMSRINTEVAEIGHLLFSILTASFVVIGTVSIIGHIPIYYWALVSLGVAYLQLVNVERSKPPVDRDADQSNTGRLPARQH